MIPDSCSSQHIGLWLLHVSFQKSGHYKLHPTLVSVALLLSHQNLSPPSSGPMTSTFRYWLLFQGMVFLYLRFWSKSWSYWPHPYLIYSKLCWLCFQIGPAVNSYHFHGTRLHSALSSSLLLWRPLVVLLCWPFLSLLETVSTHLSKEQLKRRGAVEFSW